MLTIFRTKPMQKITQSLQKKLSESVFFQKLLTRTCVSLVAVILFAPRTET
jgi:hypothetical protein